MGEGDVYGKSLRRLQGVGVKEQQGGEENVDFLEKQKVFRGSGRDIIREEKYEGKSKQEY